MIDANTIALLARVYSGGTLQPHDLAGLNGSRAIVDALVAIPASERRTRAYDALANGGLNADEIAAVCGLDNAAKAAPIEGKTPRPADDELAQQWLDENPNTAHGLGEFRRYGSGVWAALPSTTAEKEILRVIQSRKADGVRANAAQLASVSKLAQVLSSIEDSKWDSDFDLLVCTNGTLHIPTLTLRPHAQEDLQTSAVPYSWDANATAPTWERVMRENVPADCVNFLQEFAGYCITTSTCYELAVWFVGARGSGKSTIIEGFRTMLGERVGLLGLREIERSSFALSGIIGKTLLVSTEQPSDYMQSTHILNRLISGEHVHVDRKFRDPLELQSRAKILWAMNKPPRQQDLEDGIFRRIKVVSFGEMKGDPDPTIKQKLAGEGAGILGWALEGLARLNKRGRFDIPASVEQATREYQDKNDVPAAFVDECCIKQADAKVQSSELYEAYKFWSQKSGHTPKSSTSIADDWKRLGFTWAQSNGRKYWKGVGLLSRSSE